MRRRGQHVLRVLKQADRRIVERHLDDRAARRQREHAVRLVHGRHLGQLERHGVLRRGDEREHDRRRRRAASWLGPIPSGPPVRQITQQRGHPDAGENRQREADHHAKPGGRSQPREHRQRRVQRGIELPGRSERRPERQNERALRTARQLASRCWRRATHNPADAKDRRDKARKHRLLPRRQELQQPGMRVGRARQIRAPVGRVAVRLLRALRNPPPRCSAKYGRNAGSTSAMETTPATPSAIQKRAFVHTCRVTPDDDHAVTDHQNHEDAVVPARKGLRRHHRAERRARGPPSAVRRADGRRAC